MTKNEKRLASALLELASDQFANHGCNDFDRPKWFPKAEWDAMHKRMHATNGSPEDYHKSNNLPDWWLMTYLADELADERNGS